MDTVDKILYKSIDIVWKRHGILAENIANSDTEGYVRQDIEFENELKRICASEGEYDISAVKAGSGPEAKPVKIEKEMAEIAKNTMYYGALAKIIALRERILQSTVTGGM